MPSPRFYIYNQVIGETVAQGLSWRIWCQPQVPLLQNHLITEEAFHPEGEFAQQVVVRVQLHIWALICPMFRFRVLCFRG